MKQKPVLIIILAIFHFLQPFINIVYLKLTTQFDFLMIFQNLLQLDGMKSLFDFWLLFPLGGLALLLIRKWSFFVFVAVQFYSIYLHLFYEKYTWPYVSEHPLSFSIILLIFNIFFIIYVCLPNIRALFFDETKRWWQTSRRYFINTPCQITVISSGSVFDSRIINVSKTGAFVETSVDLPKGTIITIAFNYKLISYSLTGKIISAHSINDVKGSGIKFLMDKFHSNEIPYINNLVKILKKEKTSKIEN